MATRDHDVDGARLADELAAEFGREVTAQTATTGGVAEPAAHRSARTPWVVAAMSLAVIAVQVPSIRASFGARPSLHAGAEVDDADTQSCIDELWRISALVQQGTAAETLAHLPLTEPITHAHYAVTREGDTLVVACPNPGIHGLTRLRVTDDAPMPEASR